MRKCLLGWVLLLFCIMLVATIGCTPSPRLPENAKYSMRASDVADLQTKNITPAIENFKAVMPSAPPPKENAVQLFKRIQQSEDGIAVGQPDVPVAEMPAVNIIELPAEIKSEPSKSSSSAVASKSDAPLPNARQFEPTVVAFLLPLSGSTAPTGKAIESAARLAFEKLSGNSPSLKMLFIDTKGNADGAVVAASKAMDQGAHLIFGPLTQEETESILKITSDRNVPVIAFIDNTDMLKETSNLYLFGFDVQEQIKRVMEYAYNQNIRVFKALVPSDELGTKAIESMDDLLKRKNSGITQIERYETGDKSIPNAIEKLTFSRTDNARNTANKSVGLVVADGGRVVLSIASQLFRSDVPSGQFRLLGVSSWRDPIILDEPSLQGSWFATAQPEIYADFSNGFRHANGYEPQRIASLGYDAIALTIRLADSAKQDRFSYDNITDTNGFSGANGLFRFSKSKIAQRSLAVVEIGKGRLQLLEPAPTIFKSANIVLPKL